MEPKWREPRDELGEISQLRADQLSDGKDSRKRSKLQSVCG